MLPQSTLVIVRQQKIGIAPNIQIGYLLQIQVKIIYQRCEDVFFRRQSFPRLFWPLVFVTIPAMTFLLFQEWENVEALQGHFQTDHMEEFLKALPDVLNGEVMTRRYEVRSTDELGYEDDDDEAMAEFEPEQNSDLGGYREKIVH